MPAFDQEAEIEVAHLLRQERFAQLHSDSHPEGPDGLSRRPRVIAATLFAIASGRGTRPAQRGSGVLLRVDVELLTVDNPVGQLQSQQARAPVARSIRDGHIGDLGHLALDRVRVELPKKPRVAL